MSETPSSDVYVWIICHNQIKRLVLNLQLSSQNVQHRFQVLFLICVSCPSSLGNVLRSLNPVLGHASLQKHVCCAETQAYIRVFKDMSKILKTICEQASRLSLVIFIFVCVCLQGLEGEDEGAISMLSDNTAKLTSAVRYWTQSHLHHHTCRHRYTVSNMITTRESEMIKLSSKDWHHIHP